LLLTSIAAAAKIERTSPAGATAKAGRRSRSARGGGFHQEHQQTRDQEKLRELSLRHGGHDEQHAEDAPQKGIAAIDLPRELV
jgi:hypothetical protein